ncbi:MAG TPA: cytochrome c oxidase subunit II [Devosia sp.]|nr:cytochrome c oxidase subunit II [Devosia sp.]
MIAPLDLFHPAGAVAQQVSPLLWGLLALSVVVVLLIIGAVGAALIVRTQGTHNPADVAPERSPGGLRWIYALTGLSAAVLAVFVVWTLTTMAGIATPSQPAAFTIDVVGHQWWWQFTYEPTPAAPGFVTANELHVPVGVPVRFHITSSDVIHSFWVPALGGKTDAIPGQLNDAWLEADKPGIYRGQCAEYCGQQHAQMALFVVAEPQAAFDGWRAQQAASAGATADAGDEAQFVQSCGKCHTVRGSPASGTRGPDLTHLMSRGTIAAGALPNSVGNLGGWIANPQAIKPGAKMPIVPLSGPQLQAVLRYLETLT